MTHTVWFDISQPYGIAIDGDDNVYAIHRSTSTIKKYNSDGVEQSYAGYDLSAPDNYNNAVKFSVPNTLTTDAEGNVYVGEDGGAIKKISASDQTVTTYATGFSRPYGLYFDSVGLRDEQAHCMLFSTGQVKLVNTRRLMGLSTS